MPTPPVTLPNFDHLSPRWTPSEARAVLAALDASGLRAFEFARRTGLEPRRVWRARRNAGAQRETSACGGVQLVELVPRAQPPRRKEVLDSGPDLDPIKKPSIPSVRSPTDTHDSPPPVIEVTTPTGWQLRVPGVLLVGLVQALSVRPC
jgi:hypothetical protein